MPIHQTELGGIIMNIPTGRNLYTAVNNGDEWDGMQKIVYAPLPENIMQHISLN